MVESRCEKFFYVDGIMKLNKLLNLWQKNNLISKEQNENIIAFMKERQKENFFRFLKWLSIIGAFWIVGGVIATIYNLFQLDFIQKIWQFISKIFEAGFLFLNEYVLSPIHNFILSLFGNNYGYFYWGVSTLILFLLFNWLAIKTSTNKNIDKLNLSEEQKNILKTNFTFYTIAAVSLAATFCFFNMLLIPYNSYYSDSKIFPLWNVIGAITFISLAYKYSKALYLLFGIYFVSLSAGMFSGYNMACYWIGVSRPLMQIFIAIILLLIGYITTMKIKDEDSDGKIYIREKFSSIYNLTGLLMLFLALFIASFWGFEFDLSNGNYSNGEIVFANILFITTSIGAMYYGTKTESKLYFNYGLTFLILETYTLFCSRLWGIMPFGVGALLFGVLIVGTVKILKKIYIKKNIENAINKSE